MSESDDQNPFAKPFGDARSEPGSPFGQSPVQGANPGGGPAGFGSEPTPGGFGTTGGPGHPGSGPGGAPPGGGGGSMGHIPFDSTEAGIIRGLATLLTIAAALGVITALVSGANGVATTVIASRGSSQPMMNGLMGNLLGTVISLGISGILAFWLLKAAKSFRKMVDTDGADQALLIDALAQLRNVFWMKAILYMFAFLCIACVLFGMYMFVGAVQNL